MKTNTALYLLASLALAAAPSVGRAQNFTPITQWNFNSNPPDASLSTGAVTPSLGAGSLTLTGTATSTFATGSPGDPATADNTALNVSTFPAQSTASGTTGVQFNTSTAGFTGAIQLSLDFRQSGTTSYYFQLQLSTNGTTFVNAAGGMASVVGPINSPNTGTTFTDAGLYSNNSSSGSQTFVQGITYTLPAGSPYANDANFAFRWVSVFDPANGTSYTPSNTASTYATNGTARFDEVTISQMAAPVPEPATYFGGALVVATFGIACLRRMRRAA